MVSARYLVDKPVGPSNLQRLYNQHVLPPAIDATTRGEAVLERIAQASRRRPFKALGIAFGVGFLAARLRRRSLEAQAVTGQRREIRAGGQNTDKIQWARAGQRNPLARSLPAPFLAQETDRIG